jgi:hypothetical protein
VCGISSGENDRAEKERRREEGGMNNTRDSRSGGVRRENEMKRESVGV